MRTPLGSSPARLAAVTLGVAAATFSLVGAPAQAAPDRSDAPSGHAARTVTLPSGDKLSVQTDPTGRLLLSPVGPGTAMETRTRGGDVYAFPVAAMRAQGASFDPARYDVSALLRGEKTAPPAVHPDFPMRTVTLNITDDQGQPSSFSLLTVVNVDDSRTYTGFQILDSGLVKISVPDGHYTAMATQDGPWGTTGPSYERLAFTDFTVAGGPTSASVDLRTATHPLTIDPVPGTDRVSRDVAWYRGGNDSYGAISGFASFDCPFYTSDSPATAGVQHLYVHDRDETPAGAAKPAVYDAEFPTDGAISGDHTYQVDPSTMARLDTSYHSDTAQTGYSRLFGTLPWEWGAEDRPYTQLPVPLRRTEYVSTGHGLAYRGDIETAYDATEFVSGGYHTYRPGQHVKVDWMAGPIAPGLPIDTGTGPYACPACRSDDTLSVILTPVTDSVPEHGGQLPYPQDGVTSSSRFQLFQGDTPLADETDSTGGDFAVGPDPAGYRVVYDQTRITPVSNLSTSSHSEWTFRSRHSGARTVPDRWLCGTKQDLADCSAVSLLTVKYGLPQGIDGTIGTGPQAMTLTVGHTSGSPAVPVRQATAAISYDQGAHWTQVPVTRTADGTFVARWTNARSTSGQKLSVKVTATDGAGATVTQSVTDVAAIVS